MTRAWNIDKVMKKTLILAPNSGPPFSNTIELERAVFFNVNERTNGPRTDALALLLSNLLSELIDRDVLDHNALSRILVMQIDGIETPEQQPPYPEFLQ